MSSAEIFDVVVVSNRDVKKLAWDAGMNKRLVRATPIAQFRILCKDLAHLAGLTSSA